MDGYFAESREAFRSLTSLWIDGIDGYQDVISYDGLLAAPSFFCPFLNYGALCARGNSPGLVFQA